MAKPRTNNLTPGAIDSSSDDELFSLLGEELKARIGRWVSSGEYVAKIRNLPLGLRAMAATYELDVSLALDDLGWHFGNWHDAQLAVNNAWPSWAKDAMENKRPVIKKND